MPANNTARADEPMAPALPAIATNGTAHDEQLVDAEDPIVAALFTRGRNRRETVEVARLIFPNIKVPAMDEQGRLIRENGTVKMEPFSFRVRPIKRKERQRCEQDATERVPDPSLGRMAMRDVVDQAEAEQRMLYLATVPEDRTRYWDNQKLQQAYNVGAGFELIGEMLDDMAQAQAILTLMELSGGQSSERELLKG